MIIRLKHGVLHFLGGLREQVSWPYSEGVWVGAVAICAIAMRCLAVWMAGDFRAPITWEYGQIASHLLGGDGFVITSVAGTYPYRSWLPPVYPFFLAGFMLLPLGMLWLQLAQACLSGLTCLLLFFLGRRLFGKECGLVAAILMAIYPPLILKVGRIDPVTLEALFLSGALLGLIHFHDTHRRASGVAAGLLLALCVLTKPVLLVPFVLLSLMWFVWKCIGLRQWMWIALPLCLGLLPWTARNYAIHGTFVPVSTNSGYNLWIGNNALATGEAYGTDGTPIWTQMPPELIRALADQNEVGRSRMLSGMAFDWIVRNPAQFIDLSISRMGYFWWFRPRAGVGQNTATTYSATWVIGYKLVYGVLLLLAVVGVMRTRRLWPRLLPLYAALIGVSATYSVFFIHTRYRMALEPTLMLFAAVGVCRVLGRRFPTP